ncbi:hypothetical protein BC834DRAFT_529782 [Gloeopeniophorella convolvens]|nr:hypothetical protein BC834DRAFT_529782 [Gloeopeniophorella convolvens]
MDTRAGRVVAGRAGESGMRWGGGRGEARALEEGTVEALNAAKVQFIDRPTGATKGSYPLPFIISRTLNPPLTRYCHRLLRIYHSRHCHPSLPLPRLLNGTLPPYSPCSNPECHNPSTRASAPPTIHPLSSILRSARMPTRPRRIMIRSFREFAAPALALSRTCPASVHPCIPPRHACQCCHWQPHPPRTLQSRIPTRHR